MATPHEIAILLKFREQGRKILNDLTKKDIPNLEQAALRASRALAGGLAIGAGAAAAGIAASVASATEFEATMSGVKAVSGATAEEFELLRQKALQLGKDTVFSATDAAKGLEELVKGGISTKDILDGAAAAALNLASAGSVPLTQAAEQMSDAMNVFSLSGADAAHAADLIAGAANASSMSVTDFGFSLKMVGAVAKLSGQDIDSTAQAIAVMAAHGLKGSDAGTSLKTMLMNLQPSTKRANEAFRELGIITEEGTNLFVNEAGAFRSMAEIAEVLRQKTEGLTESERMMKLEVMFGSDAIRAAAVMAEEGAAGFEKMADAMGKVTAAEVASTRLDNLKGDLEQAKGSAETLAISIGSLLQPSLRELAKNGTASLDELIVGVDSFQSRMDELIAAHQIDQLSAALMVLSERIEQAIGPETAALFRSTTTLIGRMAEGFGSLFKSTEEGGSLLSGFFETWSSWMNFLGGQIDAFIDRNVRAVLSVTAFAQSVGRLGSEVMAAAMNIGRQLIEGIKTGVEQGFATLSGWLGDRMSELPDVVKRVLDIKSPSGVFARQVGIPITQGIQEGIGEGLPALIADVEKMIGGALPAAATTAAVAAKPRVAKSVADHFFSAVSEVARNDALLRDIGDAGASAMTAYTEAFERGDKNAAAKAANAVQRMINDARKAGVKDAGAMGGALIDALGLALKNGDKVLRDIAIDSLMSFGMTIQQAEAMAKAAEARQKGTATQKPLAPIGTQMSAAAQAAIFTPALEEARRRLEAGRIATMPQQTLTPASVSALVPALSEAIAVALQRNAGTGKGAKTGGDILTTVTVNGPVGTDEIAMVIEQALVDAASRLANSG